MGWRGAEYEGEFPSLGWQVLEWIEDRFRVPDGPLAGEALRYTDEQATRLVRWYALDERGRFVHRRGAKRGPKGEGKSPEAAVLAIAELCGPVMFDGWDADGEPVGRAPTAPWVQVAAVSEDQTDNTYGWLYELLRESPVVDEEHLDVGLTRVFLIGRQGMIEPVTASAGTREGQRVSFGILDETHLWLPSNGGKKLAAVLRRNAAKMGGRTWETTNAYIIGQDSVAEDTHRAAERGAPGLLYESKQAPAETDIDVERSLRAGLKIAYGDSLAWVDLDRLVAEIRDPATTRQDAKRFYLNLPVEIDVESWLADYPAAWANCESPLALAGTDRTAMAVDMSLRHDSTAVGVVGRIDDRLVVRARIYRASAGGKIDFIEVVDQIRAWAVEFQPSGIAYDPRFLELIAAELAEDGLPMVEFPQSPERMVPACGHLFEQIVGGTIAHDGDPDLADHISAAVWRENERGRTLSKGKSKRPIDGAVMLAMACWELEQVVEALPAPDIF